MWNKMHGMHSFETSPFVLPPRQERSRAALARIIGAASEILIRQGGENFSIAEIAAAANVPVGNIYRRFKSKEDIVQAIKLDATVRLETATNQRLDGQNFHDIRGLVFAYAESMAAAFEKDEALHRVLFSHALVTPALSSIGMAGRSRIFERYTAALKPLLAHVQGRRKATLAHVSFQITAMAFVAKARADDPLFAQMPWADVAREFAEAAVLYLCAAD